MKLLDSQIFWGGFKDIFMKIFIRVVIGKTSDVKKQSNHLTLKNLSSLFNTLYPGQ